MRRSRPGCVSSMLALMLASCVTPDASQFIPESDAQRAIVRDGVPALLSEKPSSVVMVKPAPQQPAHPGRSAYVVAIFNGSTKPMDFTFGDLSVHRTKSGQPVSSLKTYSYAELVKEERRKQVAAAIITGLAGAANAAAAANSGYYTASGTVTSSYGISHVTVTGYDPTAAALAQANASAQNRAMIDNVVATGRANLDTLAHTIIKDNTILPGEWYGGVLEFDDPQGEPPKSFRITVSAGADIHDIDVIQSRPS